MSPPKTVMPTATETPFSTSKTELGTASATKVPTTLETRPSSSKNLPSHVAAKQSRKKMQFLFNFFCSWKVKNMPGDDSCFYVVFGLIFFFFALKKGFLVQLESWMINLPLLCFQIPRTCFIWLQEKEISHRLTIFVVPSFLNHFISLKKINLVAAYTGLYLTAFIPTIFLSSNNQII